MTDAVIRSFEFMCKKCLVTYKCIADIKLESDTSVKEKMAYDLSLLIHKNTKLAQRAERLEKALQNIFEFGHIQHEGSCMQECDAYHEAREALAQREKGEEE